MKEDLQLVQDKVEQWQPEEVLQWALTTYQEKVAISSGFGPEGMVLIDLASRVAPRFRVFTIDTEFLFPETYDLIGRVEKKYGIRVERVFSALTPDEQEQEHGASLWARDPDQCCNLRKVVPLKGKLAGLDAWITAIRRDQTADRANALKVEWDEKFNLVKINPLADWSSQMVWDYVRKNDVPYNELHDRNYPSIGCVHCTRAVLPGEDPRSGRWAGSQKTECGLHQIETPNGPILVRNAPEKGL